MNVDTASTIIFRVRDEPGVQWAQSQVEARQKEVDRIDLALQGDFSTRQTLYPVEVNGMWEAQHYTLRYPIGMLCLAGIVGCGLAAGFATTLVPFLSNLHGLATVGGIIGGFKTVPKLVGKYIARPALVHRVDRQMTRYLHAWREREEASLERARHHYDAVVQEAARRLADEAAKALAEQPAQPGKTVRVDDDSVRLGHISVPRRTGTSSHDA
jgi:hypothetical protein